MEVGTGITRAEPEPGRRFSLSETARILELPAARLRALARAGFLAPQRGPIGPLSFGFQDLLLLRTTRGLVEAGVPMRRIRRMWASLREQLDAVPLTSITVHADGEEIVATDGNSSWRPDSGQVLLNFETSEIAERAADMPGPGRRRNATRADLEPVAPGGPVATGSGAAAADALADAGAARRLSAEEWYEIGCELETSVPEQAREAYERALALDPLMADAHVNLGRVLHVAGERGRAEPHYRQAVKLDPDDPTPHFNLGVLLEESGRRDEAVLAYRQAIVRDPEFADAHCNLGLLLESMGNRQEAIRHLMAARQLKDSEE